MPDQQHRYGPKALGYLAALLNFLRTLYPSCYVALKIDQWPPGATLKGQRHITIGATLRIKCGAPHLMREFRSHGSVRGALSDGRSYRESSGYPRSGLEHCRRVPASTAGWGADAAHSADVNRR